jgi:hypothetical protein
MTKVMMKTAFTVGLLVLLLAVPVFGATINKSIHIEAGGESSGATSVNGSVSVGENAVVSGNVKTVNGSVRVDSGAKIRNAATVNGGIRLASNVHADDLSTVNGSIKVGENGVVDGEIEAVNGRISIKQGSNVADDVSNVNGKITLAGTVVGGDLATVSGDIEVIEGSVVKGDLIVEKPSNWGWGKSKDRTPRIVIGPGSSVEGDIRLERRVELFISDTASVHGVTGTMTIDDAVRFSGDRP